MSPDEIMDSIEQALFANIPERGPIKYYRDEFGAVWFTGGQNGCMSRDCFEALDIGAFSELPTLNAYDQNVMLIE